MAIYDPIEFPVGDARGGYGYHSNNVATPGYETRRGYEFTAVKVYGTYPDAGYINVCVSWNTQAMTEEPNLVLPGLFVGGDENVSYKVTIQAIDTSEEE